MPNIQDIFRPLTETDIKTALKSAENGKLLNNISGSGQYGFGQPYTIGYGYDISQQKASQIKADFQAANIVLAPDIKAKTLIDTKSLEGKPYSQVISEYTNVVEFLSSGALYFPNSFRL